MKIAMLWWDADTSADLKTKIGRAADYYHKKYGEKPNLCFVHPGNLPANLPTALSADRQDTTPLQIDGIIVKPKREIMPNHFWIGVEEHPC